MRKLIVICSLLCMILAINGCSKSNTVAEITETSNSTGFIQKNKMTDKKLKQDMETDPVSEQEVKKAYVIQSNIVEPESTVVLEKVEYQVGKIEITKQIGDRDKNEFRHLWEETDKEGNITNDSSYAFVHVTIKNVSNSNKEIYIGETLTFSIIEEDGAVMGIPCEPVYINPLQNKNDHHKTRLYTLEPEKTYEIDIAFLIEDSMINNNLYFQIGASGVEGVLDPNSRFIHVGANGE